MNARELLRCAAGNLYGQATSGGNPKHVAEMEQQSAALRLLAERWDAAMAACENDPSSDRDAIIEAAAILDVLKRLDAPPGAQVTRDHKYDCNSTCDCGNRACDRSACAACGAPKGTPCNLRVHFPKGREMATAEGMVLVPWPELAAWRTR